MIAGATAAGIMIAVIVIVIAVIVTNVIVTNVIVIVTNKSRIVLNPALAGFFFQTASPFIAASTRRIRQSRLTIVNAPVCASGVQV